MMVLGCKREKDKQKRVGLDIGPVGCIPVDGDRFLVDPEAQKHYCEPQSADKVDSEQVYR